MARPLRLEFSGTLYHVTSRGDRREDIYESDADRAAYVDLLGFVCETFNWVCHAYCLMDNHHHLLVETPDANLSKLTVPEGLKINPSGTFNRHL